MADVLQPDNNTVSPNPQAGQPVTYNNWSGELTPQQALEQGERAIASTAQTKLSGASVIPISPNLVDISGRYPLQNIGYNNEEAYAQSQAWYSKLANASVKMAGIGLTTFIEGTAGLISGVYNAASDGKLSSFYDNEFSRSLQEFNENLENSLPNYYTEAELSREWDSIGNVTQNLFSANFMFDKVLKNMGFILGMWGSAASYSAVLKGINGLSKLTASSKIDDALSITDDIIRSGKPSTVGSRITDAIGKLGPISDPAQRVIISGLSTIGEAKIEALQTATKYKDDLISKYVSEKGIEPTGEELKKIEDLAAEAGNSVYGLNTALLTLSNYIVLPKLLGSSLGNERTLFNQLKKDAIRRGEGGAFEVTQSTNRFGRIARKSANIASSLFSTREALEESSQFVVSSGVDNYYNKKYEGESVSVIDDLFGEGIQQTLGSKEGIENLIIGGLSGGIIETITGASGRDRNREQQRMSRILGDLNQSPFLSFTQFTKDSLDSVNRHTVLEAEKIAAIRQGDVLEAKELEQDIAHNYLVPRIKHDRFDLVAEDINNYRQLASTAQGFQQLKDQGVVTEEDTPQSFLNRLQRFEAFANRLKETYTSLNLKYSVITNADGSIKYPSEVIDKLAYAQTKIADYNTRIPQLQSELIAAGVNTSTIIDTISKQGTPSTQATQDAINYINGLDIVKDEKNELKTKLSDVIELALRKKNFIQEYDDILENPTKFKDRAEEDIQDADVVDEEAIEIAPERTYQRVAKPYKVRKKRGEDKFELVTPEGTVQATYDTREEAIVQLNFENQRLEDLSEVTVARPTLSGLYEVTTRSGNIEYFTPEQFKGYELVKTEEEKAAEREEVNNNLGDLQDDLNTTDGGEEPPVDNPISGAKEPTSPAKPLNILFTSGTQNQELDGHKPVLKNLNEFLANYWKFPNKDFLKVIVATPANAAYLGIEGYDKVLLEGVTGPVAEPIVYIVVEKDGSSLYFIDKQGNRIGKVTEGLNEGVPLYEMIMNTLPSDSLTWENGQKRYHTKGLTPAQAEAEAAAYQKAWQEDRAKLLSTTKSTPVYDFISSPGIAVRYEDSSKRNSLQSSIVRLGDINAKGLIKINFEGQYLSESGITKSFPKGVLVLEYGPTVEPLENRTLTKREGKVTYEILKKIVTHFEQNGDPKDPTVQRYLRYIQGLIYTGPKDTANKIWFDRTRGTYRIGNLSIPLTLKSFEDNRKEILEELSKIYVGVNSKKLRDNNSFEEILGFNDDGTPKVKRWASYQRFLIEEDGRDVSEIPYTTSIVNPAIFLNRYIIGPQFLTIKNEAPVIEPAPTPTEPSPNRDTTVRTVETARGIFSYTGTTVSDIEIIEDEAFNSAYSELEASMPKQFFIDLIKEKINQTPATSTPPTVAEQEKAENTVKDNPPTKDTAPDDFDPYAGSQYREVGAHWDHIVGNINKEEKWFKERFNIPFHRLENLIRTTSGGYAWGMFKDNAVYVYQNAEQGTAYHEAFEAMWFMYTDLNEKKNILDEFKSRSGTYVDAVTGEIIKYSEATEQQAKEELAEEFRHFILNKELKVKPVKNKNFIARFFMSLVDFIKKFFVSPEAKNNTQELFERIDGGYYKGAAPLSFESTPQYSRVKINDLTAQDSFSVIQGVTALVFQRLFQKERTSSLVNFDEPNTPPSEIYREIREYLRKIYTTNSSEASILNITDPALKIQYQNIWNAIDKDWDGVVELTNEYLRLYGVKTLLSPEGVVNVDEGTGEETVTQLNTEDESESNEASSRSDSYVHDAFTYDFIKRAPTSIKLLIGTLTQATFQVLQDGSANSAVTLPKLDPGTYMQQLNVYSSMFNKIMTAFLPTNTMEQRVAALKQMAATDATYTKLYNKLMLSEKPFSNFNMDDWKLWLRFLNVFSKQRPLALVEYRTSDGTYISAENTNILTKEVIQSWVDTWKTSGKGLVTVEGGVYTFNGSRLSNIIIDASNIDSVFSFMDLVGIEVSPEEFSRLSRSDRADFIDTLKSLKDALSTKSKITEVNTKSLDQAGRLTKLANYYVSIKESPLPSTFTSLSGEQEQQNIQHNAVSFTVNDINAATTRDELNRIRPEYTQDYQKDGIYLNSIVFNKEGVRESGFTFKMASIKGVLDTITKKVVQLNASLTEAGRLLENINSNINKFYNTIVPADSKTEWQVAMEHIIEYPEFTTEIGKQRTNEIFSNYFQTEKNILRKNKGYKGLMLSLYSGEDGNFSSDKLWEGIEQEKIDIRNLLISGGFLKVLEENGVTTYQISSLDRKFAEQHGLLNMNERELENFLDFYVVNFMINQVEMHKLFFGDPANIGLKRYKSFLSPVERSQDSPELNNFLNSYFNTVGGIQLTPGTPGYQEYKSTMDTITFEDVYTETPSIVNDPTLPESTTKKYKETNSTDAQAIMPLRAFLQLAFKRNASITKGQEKQATYNDALDRILIDRDSRAGIVPEFLQWTYPSETLRKHDEEIVAQGNPHSGKFPPFKPLAAGQARLKDSQERFTLLDKYSIHPTWYSLYRTEVGGKVTLKTGALTYLKMIKEGISYGIYESGRKVGAKEKTPIFDKEGNFNTSPYTGVIEVPFTIVGIQVETEGEKEKVTMGKQPSRLDKSDLLSSGVPIDTKYTPTEWNNLDEEEKLKPPIYSRIKRSDLFLEQRISAGYYELLNKFGIVDTGNSFVIENYEKVENLLQEELLRREASHNKKSSIRLNKETQRFDIPFEATSAYPEIKDILFSQVDRLIAKPKVSGGQRIMVSDAGFEVSGYRVKVGEIEIAPGEKRPIYTSEGLKFYEATYSDPANPTPETRLSVSRAECLVGNWFAKAMRKANSSKTDEELLNYLNNTTEGKQIMEAIGFRIPTQNLNSIEALTVVGFLPEEFGDAVVLPDAITTKAGSDFDVDKLNMYLKNVYIGSDGLPHLMKFEEIDTSDESELTDFYERHLLSRYSRRDKSLEAAGKLMGDIADEFIPIDEDDAVEATQIEKGKPVLSLEEFIEEAKGIDIFELNRLYNRFPYKKIVENEYFDAIADLVLLPSNFPRLVQPNSKDELLAIKNTLVKASPKEFGLLETKASVLSPMQMMRSRHIYVGAKGSVGAAALAQTGNAISQLTPLYINPANVSRLPENMRSYVKDTRIRLPHNTVDVMVNGRRMTLPTISKPTSVTGKAISDTLSQYIDGFVDVANDPFIAQIVQHKALLSTILAMARLGIPEETTVLFINQPIIREYIKFLLENKSTYFYISDNIDIIKSRFPVSGSAIQAKMNTGVPIDSSSKTLSNAINKYYETEQPFTDEENIQQQNILEEFLKYSVIGQNVLDISLALGYDNAGMSQPAMRQLLEKRTERAINKSLFSGVDEITKEGSIAALIENTGRASSVTDSAFFAISSPRVRDTLRNVRAQILNRNIVKRDDYYVISNKITSSFLDYMLQTNTELGNRIPDLVFNTSTAVALKVAKLKRTLRKQANTDLYKNPILKNLIAIVRNRPTDAKNVSMVFKSNKAFDSDRYAQAFREIKNSSFPIDDNYVLSDLYNDLVALSFLQTGVGQSRASFSAYIPFEDYAASLAPLVKWLESGSFANIEDFYHYAYFFKNNWNDTNIVPEAEDVLQYDDEGLSSGSKYRFSPPGGWYQKLQKEKGIVPSELRSMFRFHKLSNVAQNAVVSISTPVSIDFDPEQGGEVIENFKILLRRLDDPNGEPVLFGVHYAYFPINALGNGFMGQEYPNNPTAKSLYNNGYEPQDELTPEEIYSAYLEYKASTQTKEEVEQEAQEAKPEVKQVLTTPVEAPFEEPIVEATKKSIILKDGVEYMISDIDSTMLEAMGYTPEEIDRLLRDIC